MRDGDTDGVVDLLQSASRQSPDEARQTEERLRHIALVHLVAELDGRLVGRAALVQPPLLPRTTVGFGGGVQPASRGQGIGAALWDAVVAHVPEHITRVMSFSDDRDDDASLPWLAARHFTPFQHSITSVLHLDAWHGGPAAPPGVYVRVLDPETVRDDPGVTELYARSDTSPEAAAIGETTWQQELDMSRAMGSDEGVVALALRDGSAVALALAGRVPGSDVWHVMYTGVDPDHRGAGLAAVVKSALHDEVAARGGARLETDNEASNTGIRHVNEQLGYVKESGTRRHLRDLVAHPLV